MNFSKLHGLANDFILIERGPEPHLLDPTAAAALCDRRTGIGADGTLELIAAPEGLRLIIRNADGTRPEMCGNGLRCIGRYLANRRRLPPAGVTIQTDAGPRRIWRQGEHFSVEMGQVRRTDRPTLDLDASAQEGELYDVGNPHLILWGSWTRADVLRHGPRIEHDARFPEGINVSFASPPLGSTVDVTIWERGSGLTGACGSGACAVAVAAWSRGARGPLTVRQPGGDLILSGTKEAVTMTGPAEEVYTGRWSRLNR